ncbi:hypothetical protein Mal15_46040 [Stieleria maiorica]|uniref:Uncharacterized protein n=1 Tax=Stieleria maiorica TaxID=2795974 RepID=A0A5B9MI12_9BACT|nr:DUF6493 family protein [Stieleria maiorica]QEG00534.1 hypothetical protein Mal15_46040 [Stieleria maiorica]
MTLAQEIRTPEGFLQRLHSVSPKVFAKAVADFTDTDRRKLSNTAQEHAKALRKQEREATTLSGVSMVEMIRRGQSRLERKNLELAAAHLGLLAVAPKSANMIPLTNARALSETWSATEPTEHETAAITILLDRRPDWAQQWLERQLEAGDWSWSLMWPSVKRLLDNGLCAAPDTEGFARFMHFVLRGSDLAERPELAEYIWLQFRHSTGFLNSNGKLRQPTDPAEIQRWSTGAEWLWHNVHHGRVDRGRVIEEALAAYWRDFTNAERATLGKLLEALALTDEEFVKHQAEFRKLISNDSPAVVTFALKMLKAKTAADGFDADAVMRELPRVFPIATKTQPKSALVLLKSLVGKNTKRVECGCHAAAEALRHEEVDVQEAAVKLLEGWSKTFVPTEALQQSLNDVFPAVRSRIEALLAAAGVEVDDADRSDQIDTVEVATEIFREIEGCPPSIRRALALDESLTAATAGALLPRADINALPVDLGRLDTVQPLESVHDLIDAVSEIIGSIQSPMQLERVLDGISRFGADYPDGFTERVAPILARFESNDNRIPPFQDTLFFPSTYGLIFDWMRKNLQTPPARLPKFLSWVTFDPPNIAKSLDLRAGELRRSFLQTRPSLPLLSLPTHEHGWIDPQEFVSRLKQYIDAEQEVCPADLRLGLLRLPPNSAFKSEALIELPDAYQRLLAYLSGEDADVQSDDDPSFWLVAGRSRNPRGNLPELSALKIPDTAWGLVPAEIKVWLANSPSAIEYNARQHQKELAKKQNEGGGTSIGDRLRQAGAGLMAMTGIHLAHAGEGPLVSIEPSGDGAKSEFPTVVMASRVGSFRRWFDGHLPDWAEQWQAMHWPSNTDGNLAIAMVLMLIRMDNNASSWEPSAPALRPLLWSECAWSETALTALWLGLFAKDVDVRAVATDALTEGILDGRAHPDELSPTLVDLLQHPWLKLNRLAESLTEVVRVSSWAAMVVSEVLSAVIASWNDVPRDGHHLLTVQLAALMEVDGQLPEEARQPLQQLKGGSKTAKLAKQLLALEGPNQSGTHNSTARHSNARRRALLEGLQCRMQRLPQF